MDEFQTANFGFYNYLIPGDLVLADRGFNIADDLALHGASLVLPSFTKCKVEVSRSFSQVQIHVERAIGRLKHLKLLQLRLPISMIKTSKDTHLLTIDKILFIVQLIREGWWYIGIKGDGGVKSKGTRFLIEKEK